MSMVLCDACDRLIDSDIDTDCFVEVPALDLEDCFWCENCREEHLKEQEMIP